MVSASPQSSTPEVVTEEGHSGGRQDSPPCSWKPWQFCFFEASEEVKTVEQVRSQPSLT